MDTLSDILNFLQLRGTLYFRTSFSPPWSIAVPSLGQAARFHLVAQGTCHVVVAGQAGVTLGPGDLIVVPNGQAHTLCDSPGAAPAPLEEVLERAGFKGDGVLVYGGGLQSDAPARLICGHLSFAEGASHPLIRALPDCLIVRAEQRAQEPWLDEILRLITGRIFSGAPGATASVIRLSEALFIEVIRTCATREPVLRNILDAIEDPRIGRALGLMQRDLQQDWTVEGMAREIGMSRSRFADRFQDLMGCAPMSYLSELRLQRAASLLSATAQPIQSVAALVGYQSPAAFSRAFASQFGRSPSAYRRAAV